MYIDDLLRRLRVSGAGCYIGHTYFGAIAYADDIFLLYPSVNAACTMLNVAKEYSHRI